MTDDKPKRRRKLRYISIELTKAQWRIIHGLAIGDLTYRSLRHNQREAYEIAEATIAQELGHIV